MNRFDYTTFCSQLSFFEANIVIGSSFLPQLPSFLLRLDTLSKNTKDPYLHQELKGLIEKLNMLTDAEYTRLRKDAESGTILFPPNYQIKFSTNDSLDYTT